jgi:hypothetical protein
MSIGSTTRPVYIDNNGNVRPIDIGASKSFIGTDTNGNLVQGNISNLIASGNNLVTAQSNRLQVRHNIPSGYTGPIGINSDKVIVPQTIDTAAKIPRPYSLYAWNLTHYHTFNIQRSVCVNNDIPLQVVDTSGNIYYPDGSLMTGGLQNVDVFINCDMYIADAPPDVRVEIRDPASSNYDVIYRVQDTGRVEAHHEFFSCILPKGYGFRFLFPKYAQMPRDIQFKYRICMHRLKL